MTHPSATPAFPIVPDVDPACPGPARRTRLVSAAAVCRLRTPRLVRTLAGGALLALAGPLAAPPHAVAQGVLPGAASGASQGAARRAPAARPIEVRWIGHAAFEIVSPGGTRLLIDPWLAGNPAAPDSLKDPRCYTGALRPAAILVSHAHYDHATDAKALALASGAKVVGAYEWVLTLGLPAAQAVAGNVGGTVTVGDVIVHLVPAVHSSEPGRPIGFVLEFADGRTLYHTGDTWPFADMALIQELYHPSILLLVVGGGVFTQDPAAAALAVRKYFRPAAIVPMHFGDVPGLATEAQVRAAFPHDPRLVVMRPGEVRTF